MCVSVKSSALGVLLGALLLAGCADGMPLEATQLLQRGYDLYEAGNDQAAMRYLDAFIKFHSKAPRADEAYYLRGMAKRRTGDPQGAKADFNSVLERTANPQVRASATVAG